MNRTIPTNFPDELNLARYVIVVRRQWRVLLVCAVLGVGVAFLYGTMQPRLYLAQAQVAVVRTGTIVSFDNKIRTVSDTDPNSTALEQVSRRASLLVIGKSQHLASAVIAKIGTHLPDTVREPELLAARVQVANNGDLFSFRVMAETPELAALIANTWSQEYETRVNRLYSERPESLEIIKGQAAQAKADYDTQQTALVKFLGDNPIESLKRDQASLIIQLDTQVRVETKLTQLASDVQALRSRLQTSGATVSGADELTQLLIQANAFNNGGDGTSSLRLDVTQITSATTTEQQLAQLDALSKAIEQRRTALSPEQKQALYTQLSKVQSDLEALQQQLKELQAARDLAWGTYQTLNTKVSEVAVSAGSENQLVRIADAAVVPTAPVPSRSLLNIIIGGALGLIVGFLLALWLDFQRARAQVPTLASHKPAPQ
jgi:polysaccharide biosynthesis transport protein